MRNLERSDLPPIPAPGTPLPQVCQVVVLYLAVWDDLTEEQQQFASLHAQTCAYCTGEQRKMSEVTQLLRHTPATYPSAQVDQAVMTAIARRAARDARPPWLRIAPLQQGILVSVPSWRLVSIAAVAVILFATIATLRFVKLSSTSPQQAFLLPTTLTWATYVLYHTETRLNKEGQHYHIDSYDNLANGMENVETVEEGTLDVVVVGDKQKTLGLDMMHHVAQWGANDWMSDESMFDLAALQSGLRTGQDTYLGKDKFRGISVYRIRCQNGLILLLDMHYMPVNVLRGAIGPGTGEPVYDTLQLLAPSRVSSSMWEMSVPAGFSMGTLPPKP